jgi:creatinine amidohydrolase
MTDDRGQSAPQEELHMKWHELTSDDLAAAREKAQGVAMIPIGSLERHGPHLPLGCDTLGATAVAERVAAIEPVVVLPTMPYTFVPQCKFQPGAINVRGDILMSHLAAVCGEIYRNGFDKIVLMHAHGGNVPMSQSILQHVLEEEKPWAVYSIPPLAGTRDVIRELIESEHYGHAGEVETSVALALFPDLCHMDRVAGKTWAPNTQLDVSPANSPIDWIATWPEMTVGQPGKATREKGERIVEAWVNGIVEALRKIKRDETVPSHLRRLRSASRDRPA